MDYSHYLVSENNAKSAAESRSKLFIDLFITSTNVNIIGRTKLSKNLFSPVHEKEHTSLQYSGTCRPTKGRKSTRITKFFVFKNVRLFSYTDETDDDDSDDQEASQSIIRVVCDSVPDNSFQADDENDLKMTVIYHERVYFPLLTDSSSYHCKIQHRLSINRNVNKVEQTQVAF